MLIVALICAFLLTFIFLDFLRGDSYRAGYDAALALVAALCAAFLFYYLT